MEIIKFDKDGNTTLTDHAALEMVLADYYSQIREAARRGHVDIMRQLLIYARIVERVQKAIGENHEGDITGNEHGDFIMGSENDRIQVKFDERTAVFVTKFDQTYLNEVLHEVADKIFQDGPIKEQILKMVEEQKKYIQKKKEKVNDAKAVEDFLKSLEGPSGETPSEDTPEGQ